MAKINIVKSSGDNSEYDIDKINRSICKAYIATRGKDNLKKVVPDIKSITSRIDRKINIYYALDSAKSSEIQDIVVRELMKSKYKDVAMNYMRRGIEKGLGM